MAIVVHDAEVTLSAGIPLFGCLAVPLGRLNVILRDAMAIVVHNAKGVLDASISPISRFHKKLKGRRVVFAIVCL